MAQRSVFPLRQWWVRHWAVALVVLAVVMGALLRLQGWQRTTPYWEEIALGYDAYSLVQTGRDHHGHPWPVVAFESFGDWKPAGYVYAALPFVALLGPTVVAIRLPSLLAGIALIPVCAWLMSAMWRWGDAQQVDHSNDELRDTRMHQCLVVVTAWVVATNPWLIHFSQAAWEVTLATCLLSVGMAATWEYAVLRSRSAPRARVELRQWIWLGIAVAAVVGAAYTYHATRAIAPFFLSVTLFLQAALTHRWGTALHEHVRAAWSFTRRSWREILVVMVVVLALLPIVMALRSPQGGQRWAETSLLTSLQPIVESNAAIASAENAWWAKLIFHRFWFYLRDIAVAFLQHFRLDFLVVSGDSNLRHSTGYGGLFLPTDVVLLIVGAIWWRRTRPQVSLWLEVGLVSALLPSALSYGAPHALRMLPSSPIWMLTLALGYVVTARWVWQQSGEALEGMRTHLASARKTFFAKQLSLVRVALVAVLLGGIPLLQLNAWQTYALTSYPIIIGPEWWQEGYAEMISIVISAPRERGNDVPVTISREHGRPAMYYWFFTRTAPQEVQQYSANGGARDQGEALAFRAMQFVKGPNELMRGILAASPSMLAEAAQRDPAIGQAEVLGSVRARNGEEVWRVVWAK